MKTLLSWMVAAAALAVAAGSASAQVMKAEIPFTFQVAGVRMSPGSYTIMVNSQPRYVRLTNADTRQGVLALANNPFLVQKTPQGSGILSFECAGSVCALRSIWDGDNSYGYEFRRPKLGPEPVRVAVIPLVHAKAE